MEKYIHHIKDFIEASPIGEFAGLEVIHVGYGEFQAQVNLLPFFKRHDGIAHGGFLSYIADTVMGFASLTQLEEGKTVFTAEMKISFLEPGFGETLIGKAAVIRSGKRLHFCECELFGEKNGERYVTAKASATMIVSEKKK